jgi:hypothetical protein
MGGGWGGNRQQGAGFGSAPPADESYEKKRALLLDN